MERGTVARTVIVDKVSLVETITINRNAHHEVFEQAIVRYRQKAVEFLDQRLASITGGGSIDLYFDLPEPKDYTDEYDNVLAQLEWDTRDEIPLDLAEFNRLVLNKWEWMSHFNNFTEVYTTGALSL